jgi:hypothetical protein
MICEMETQPIFPDYREILYPIPRVKLPQIRPNVIISNNEQILIIASRSSFPSPKTYVESNFCTKLPLIKPEPNDGLQSSHLEADAPNSFSENISEQSDVMFNVKYEQYEIFSPLDTDDSEDALMADNNDKSESEDEDENESNDDIRRLTSNPPQKLTINHSSLKLPSTHAILQERRKGQPVFRQFRPLRKYARRLREKNPEIVFTLEQYREAYIHHLRRVTQYLNTEHIKKHHGNLDNAELQGVFERQVQEVINKVRL